ncbi:hypothetical protein CH359_19545 [Leptospira meyeri]|nr:hypothetical protein CH359_19545 [Leptospira meyeri]PJZ94972.1 hypothetical protein CH358_19575 [Leptospira meyeri]
MNMEEDIQAYSGPQWKKGQLIETLNRVRKNLKLGISQEQSRTVLENLPPFLNYTYRMAHNRKLECFGLRKEFLYDHLVRYQDRSDYVKKEYKTRIESYLTETLELVLYFKDDKLVHYSVTHKKRMDDTQEMKNGSLSNHCYIVKRDGENEPDVGQGAIGIYQVENIDFFSPRLYDLRPSSEKMQFMNTFLGKAFDKIYKDKNYGLCKISYNYDEDVPDIHCSQGRYKMHLMNLLGYKIKGNGIFELYIWNFDKTFYLKKLSDSEIEIILKEPK